MRSILTAASSIAAVAVVSATAQAAEPVVYRGAVEGAAAEQLLATRFGVAEIRGTAVPAQPVEPTTPEPRSPQPIVVGGERLWSFDPESGDVTVCRLHHGAVTGPARIMCQSGRM